MSVPVGECMGLIILFYFSLHLEFFIKKVFKNKQCQKPQNFACQILIASVKVCNIAGTSRTFPLQHPADGGGLPVACAGEAETPSSSNDLGTRGS